MFRFLWLRNFGKNCMLVFYFVWMCCDYMVKLNDKKRKARETSQLYVVFMIFFILFVSTFFMLQSELDYQAYATKAVIESEPFKESVESFQSEVIESNIDITEKVIEENTKTTKKVAKKLKERQEKEEQKQKKKEAAKKSEASTESDANENTVSEVGEEPEYAEESYVDTSYSDGYWFDAIPYDDRDALDAGYMIEFDTNWFCAHWYTDYGQQIQALQPGDIVHVNGKNVEIYGVFDVDREAYLEDVRAEWGYDKVFFQTCYYAGSPTMMIKYGYEF